MSEQHRSRRKATKHFVTNSQVNIAYLLDGCAGVALGSSSPTIVAVNQRVNTLGLQLSYEHLISNVRRLDSVIDEDRQFRQPPA